MAAELLKDIAELENIRKSVTRSNVQNLLDKNLNEWKLKLQELNEKSNKTHLNELSIKNNKLIIRPLKKLTTYAFDESDKFVKIYYNVPNITNFPANRASSNFTENSYNFTCIDVAGIDYEVSVIGLLNQIDPAKSFIKIKSDSLLVMLKKKNENQTWKSLLKIEKLQEKAKAPKLDSNSGDPGDSLMTMMKQMYETGDDEMKRTIRKAWHESQSKKNELSPTDF